MKNTKLLYALTVAMMLGTGALIGNLAHADDPPAASAPVQPAQPAAVQPAPAPAPAPVAQAPDDGGVVDNGTFISDSLKSVIALVSSVKQNATAGAALILAVLVLIAQLLVQFTKTPLFGSVFKTASGNVKLTIVAICSVITTAVPIYLSGGGIGAVIASGAVLSAVMVAGHQVYVEFFQKSDKQA